MFGPLQVETPNGILSAADFPSRKAKHVLEILALAGGRTVSKDRLIDLVWSNKLPNNPVATLDHTLSVLRAAIGDADVRPIITERGHYRLDMTVVEIDLQRFDAMVDEAVGQPDPLGYRQLVSALALVDGVVLEDEPYADWVEVTRERYRSRVERVMLDVARRALALDDVELALEIATRARTESELVLEEAFTLCASALLRLGRRNDGWLLMHELEHRLTTEQSTTLSPEASMLRSILRGSVAAGTNHLVVAVRAVPTEPMDAIPFIGRERELELLDAAVDRVHGGANELVVVEGPLGIGKTRLFAAVNDRHPERVVHTFGCLPSDAEQRLFVATRLLRVCANHLGIDHHFSQDDTVATLFDQLADILEATGPTIVIIDDLQWADPASIALLAGLARPKMVDSLLVLVGRRPVVGDDELPDRAVSQRIELGPLDRHVVEELPIDEIWSETGGHPGLIVACLEAERLGGRLSVAAVRDAFSAADDAGSMSRVVLGAAASLAQPFTVNELALRLSLPPSLTEELLAPLVRDHALRQFPLVVGGYEFTSELIRRVMLTADGARVGAARASMSSDFVDHS
jgi:DNA-binding SARP family transcriptional activator